MAKEKKIGKLLVDIDFNKKVLKLLQTQLKQIGEEAGKAAAKFRKHAAAAKKQVQGMSTLARKALNFKHVVLSVKSVFDAMGSMKRAVRSLGKIIHIPFVSGKKHAGILERAIRKTGRTIKALRQSFLSAASGAKVLSLTSGPIMLIAGAVLRATSHFSEMYDEQTKLAKGLGITSREFERLNFAATQSGATTEQMVDGMKTLNQSIQEATQTGVGAQSDAFTELGITMNQFSGRAEEDLGVVADALNNVKDEGRKAYLSAKIFGEEAGPKMATLLAEGSEGIKKLGDSAANIDLDKRDAFTKFMDSIGELKNVFGKLMSDVLTPLLPIVTLIGEKLTGIFAMLADSGIFLALGEMLPPLLSIVEEIMAVVVDLISEIVNSGVLNDLVPAVADLVKIVLDLIKVLKPFIPLMIKGLKATVLVIRTLLGVIQTVVDAVTNFIDSTDWSPLTTGIRSVSEKVEGLAVAIGLADEATKKLNGSLTQVIFKDVKSTVGEKLADYISPDGEFVTEQERERRKAEREMQKNAQADAQKADQEKHRQAQEQERQRAAQAARSARIQDLITKAENLRAQNKRDGLSDNEVAELIAMGYDEKDAKALGKKKGGGGKKDKEKLSTVQAGTILLEFLQGKSDASRLKEYARGIAKKTPKAEAIKPTVAMTFYNFENKFTIRSTDPEKAGKNIVVEVEKYIKKANAKSAAALASNGII